MDISTASFEKEVLETSARQPVVVDFWAPWCAPCRTLGPILEKLEAEYGGRFRLAKVNLDENPALAEAFGVRSIPAVFGFREGKAVASFVGAQPEREVRAFIERLLPSPHEQSIERAEQLIARGEVDEADRLLESVPFDVDWQDRVDALRAAVGFARAGGPGMRELEARIAANADDHEARLQLAQRLAAERRWREAMEQLLAIVKKDKNWRDGEARKQLLHVFRLAGEEPDLVTEYRRKLATTLY
jgi:putative thioredoxin